ncbi:unnamed protein product, partial [Bubo scandiacus]
AFLSLTAIYSLCTSGIAGRHVLAHFQALLKCLFFNKPSSEKSHCAGSLYFTDFSSVSLSTLVLRTFPPATVLTKAWIGTFCHSSLFSISRWLKKNN